MSLSNISQVHSNVNKLSDVYLKEYNVNASPIDVIHFQSYLKGYPSKLYWEVVDIVKNGANIHSLLQCDPSRTAPQNQKSTETYKDLVDDYIWSELKLNRISGPFLHRPPGLIVSPLGAVPKRDSNLCYSQFVLSTLPDCELFYTKGVL